MKKSLGIWSSGKAESVSKWLPQFYEEMNKERTFVKTNLPALNTLLSGGLQEGVFVLSAAAGEGKTALACSMIISALRDGAEVYFCTFELSRSACVMRLLVALSSSYPEEMRLEMGALQNNELMTDHQNDGFEQAAKELEEMAERLYIFDGSEDGDVLLDAENIAAIAEATSGKKRLVVVDHLQAIPRSDSQMEELRAIEHSSNTLKDAGRLYHCPVLLLSCVTKDGAEPKGSSNISHDATITARLRYTNAKRSDYKPQDVQELREKCPRELSLIVDKNRNGSPGTIRLYYWPQWGKFEGVGDLGRLS